MRGGSGGGCSGQGTPMIAPVPIAPADTVTGYDLDRVVAAEFERPGLTVLTRPTTLPIGT